MSAVEILVEEAQLPAKVLPEVQVKFTPAVIEVNFDDLKTALTAQVEEQSNTVVTADNLVACKKLMADMNKTGGAIKAARIDYAKKAGVNIAAFEVAMKELEAISAAGVAKIKEQAARFEAENLKTIEILLGETLGREWDALNVSAEYRKARINDLVLHGSITSTGKLTGKVANDIKSRALDDKGAENAVKLRLSELENLSYRAGLKAPLTRAHVEVFLFVPEAEYQQRLQVMLQSEIQRQEQAEAQLRQQMVLEQQRNAQAEADAAERVRLAEERARQAEIAAQQASERAAQQQAAQQQQTQQPAEQHYNKPSGIKFAYAPINDPRSAKFFVGNADDAVNTALLALGKEQQIGLWTKTDGLVAIIHEGVAFYRNIAA
jgi:hypothetical protein